MTYKNRKNILLALIAVLALLYTGSLVFNSGFRNNRNASFVWLDSKLAGKANRVVINTSGEKVELIKINSQWFVLHNGKEYPARQTRIEDFINIFTARAAWSVRASSASSHERLGLTDAAASRVIIYGDNTTLLDVLLGDYDITGREIYIRKTSQNEVRSGDNSISAYVTSPVVNWYNLRLVPESENGKIDADGIQRVTVSNEGETQVFSRRNRAWTVSGIEDANIDQNSVENYIRNVFNTEGDNFHNAALYEKPVLNDSRIVVEFGSGVIKTIDFGEADETGRRLASVSGNDYIYSIPSWAVTRLFRESSSFERQ